jgi:hypothetical protein
MTPQPVETVTVEPPTNTTSIQVAVAVLTEKVTQVIGDHERRISALENRRDTSGVRGASLVAPFIAFFALIVLIADKIRWN